MDVAVVAIGSNFEASVLVTLLCKELGVEHVVAKALNPLQSRVLKEVGADEIVMPEEEMGRRLADHLLRHGVVDFVKLPEGFSLRRLDIPEDWAGKTLEELELLPQEKMNLVQIVRRSTEGGPVKIPLPFGQTLLEPGDQVDVIGPDKVLAKYL